MRQRVIVYSLDGFSEHIFCTAYTTEQTMDALIACALWLAEHGLLTATSRPTAEDAATVYAYSI